MKTPRIKSKFLIKSSIFVGAAILTAASLFSSVAQAEDAFLMPTGTNGLQPFDPDPAAPGSLTRKVLTYGVDSDGTAIPQKTLRITNNTEQTVFPIMRDPNSNVLASDKGKGLYDPYDLPDKEYRGYIGYEQGGKYFFGLKKHESILVSVPLVFWNGARIGIGTDGKFVAPPQDPNPLRYRSASQRSITKTPTDDSDDKIIKNGVVMWYRAEIAEAPNDDTEDQLAEWTIRDHGYLNNPKITHQTNTEIPDNQLVTLINYDVSNVDNLYLPLAMAANDAWVLPQETSKDGNRAGWKPGSKPDVYGWTGAINTIDFLQSHIREFTADNNKLLEEYFGSEKHGWPFYNIPNPNNDPNAPRKIPSGANVFAQSPLKAVPSSYGNGQWQNDKYMLSSGGTLPIKAGIGWAGGTPDEPPSDILHLNTAPTEREKIAFLQVGYSVRGLPPDQPVTPNPIEPGTTILQIIDRDAGTIKLSKPLIASSKNCGFEFTRPVNDYASEAMIKLWYSWAQYYLAHWKDGTPGAPTGETTITGSITENTATMSFNEAHSELVEGMAITGPGLDNAQTEKGPHQGDALILQITTDKKTVILSQVANQSSTNGRFKVRPPQSLLYTPAKEGDPGYPLIGGKFVFSNEPERHEPYKFSQQVYLIMASMNQIGQPNNNSVSKFMQNIVGANMGFIFTNPAKLTDDGKMVTAMIRDMIKSVLRGVWDFTKFPDDVDDHGTHLNWYPDPREHRGNQQFNVFNLDPFVWFVHVQLGFSGYGFSVDDDTADVGAGGASQLQLTVIDTGGLKNLNPWTIQAPYGPVPTPPLKNVSLKYSGKSVDCRPNCQPNQDIGDTLFHDLEKVSDTDTTPIRVTTKGRHQLSDGDTVVIDQVEGNTAANGRFKINNVTSITFDLFDAVTGKTPIAPSGKYIPSPPARAPGRWSYPLHPYIDSGANLAEVYYRVSGDDALGTFQGTLLSANGVDRNKKNGKKFRVWRLGLQKEGRLLLDADLTDVDGVPLPAGSYDFNFFGIAEKGGLLGGGPPFRLAAIRDDIHDEIDRIRERLQRIEKENSDTKQSEQKSRWLETRIAVLRARLDFPTDEVLEQLEQAVEARKSLGRKALRRFMDRLNTRLDQLGGGG